VVRHTVWWQGLAEERSLYERNQHLLRSADRAVHDPALDAKGEATDGWGSITKDVPALRSDHVSIKGKLLGVWQALHGGRVLDFKEMTAPLLFTFSQKGFKR
jgi:hypothetical protein